jgi:predicted aspartyl protease
MRGFAALAVALAGAACATPAGPTIAEELALVARDLREGRLEAASERVTSLRRRDPRDVGVAQWQATIASLTWRDEEAVLAQQAAIRGARARGRAPEAIAEMEGRLGDLLFLAGRFGESVSPLGNAATAAGDVRRRAFAAVAAALPFVRRSTGPLLSEQRLLAGELPEFLCGVGDRQRPFVVDTGTSMTTVSDSFAQQLAVRHRTSAGSVLDAAGRELATDIGVLERFVVGDIDVGAVPVLVVDDAAMQLRDLHGGLERVPRGILGLDLLASCRLTLDPERSSVVLEMPRGLPAEQSVSCVRVDGRCLVPVFVEDVRLWFVLDTGASHSSLTAAGLARLPGGEGRATPSFRRIRTVGGSLVAVREVRGLELRCSEAPFGKVDLPVVPRGISALFPVHGVLGIDQLRSCRLTLDRGRVRLVAFP